MTEQEIERCLERFAMGKACDVMNFDYAGTLAYLQRLKAKNADLRERLDKAERRNEVTERALLLMARRECTFASPEFYKEEAEQEVAKEEQMMANRCGEGKCEYFESIRRTAYNNREYGYCKKYKQELHLYDLWWLKCDECTAEKEIAEEKK